VKTKLTDRLLTSYALPDGKAREKAWDTQAQGFLAIVGKRSVSFSVQARVNGKQRLVKIGRMGQVREDGHSWNTAKARSRAREILGEMASGIDRAADESRRANGPTLRDAQRLHVREMRKLKRSERSIKMFRELDLHLAEWMDRPIVELTPAFLMDAWDTIQEKALEKAFERGKDVDAMTNPPGLALANRVVLHVSAVWNTLDRIHELAPRNPASRVKRGKLRPRTTRIPHDGFKTWLAAVQGMKSPIRRDVQLLALFSAARATSLISVEWEQWDKQRRLLHFRRTKGDRPYTVPLTPPMTAILERRRTENAELFADRGGDHGFVFPSISRDGERVIHVAEPKEKGDLREIVIGLHASRRTHNSVAIEIGVTQEQREALLNHNGKGVNVEHYGVIESWDHLAEAQRRVTDALLERLGVDSV